MVVLSTPERANNCLATSTNMSRVFETVLGIGIAHLIETVRKVLKRLYLPSIKKLQLICFIKIIPYLCTCYQITNIYRGVEQW